MPIDSLDRFGYPLLKRKEEIAKQVQSPESRYTIEIMGRRVNIPVISVRIELPVYRLANGRTKSAQLEYLAEHKDVRRDLFDGDNDSYDAQAAQHEILKELVRDENLLATFKNQEAEQVEPILCTTTGVVVNGNRRLCAWRMLYYDDKAKYKSFETILVAILPDMDEKGILDIEKKLQILKTMRAEYRWHAKALMAEMDLQRGLSEEDVAKSFDLSKKDLMKLIEARQLAKFYLERNGTPDKWSILDNSRYAFESMVDGDKKISDPSQKELFKKYAFDLITKGFDPAEETSGDRLYNKIREYATYISAVASKMAQDIASSTDNSSPTPKSSSADEAARLMSGGETIEQDHASIVSNAIDQGAEIQHDKINAIIETEKALKDEKKHALFLASTLSRVVSALDSAVSNGLDENANIKGVPKQLDEIQKYVDKIKKWLADKQ